MKVFKSTANIELRKIHPHPDNPRKNLGDLEEMVDSIKKNGIMQNLTVMPGHWKDGEWIGDEYTILIGHRRYAAAKKAGLDKVPCRFIEDIELKEQLGIMLEENMQRNDLTIYEQAQGFQMMLDLGETIDTIKEKTGFSETTIYHRLNIAKLDQKELKKKENDENFQLSIKDLYALEKIKSVTKRNEILKKAVNSKNLIHLANSAADDEKKEKNLKKILCELSDRKMVHDSDVSRWSNKWDIVKTFDLGKEQEKITLKKTSEQLYYNREYGSLVIATKKKQEKKESLTEEEKNQRKNKRTLNGLDELLKSNIKDTLRHIILKNVEWIKDAELVADVWKAFITISPSISHGKLREDLWKITYDEYKQYWLMKEEEKKLIEEVLAGYPPAYQMLILLWNHNSYPQLHSYNNEYNEASAEKTKTLIVVLEKFGFSVSEELEKYIDGTHEAYKKG